jgi:hypothetical protein
MEIIQNYASEEEIKSPRIVFKIIMIIPPVSKNQLQ